MQSHVVVVGNEKGGAGKSTIAIHLAAGLMAQGAGVAVIDLDLRQQSFGRFLANRRAWLAKSGPLVDPLLSMPIEVRLGENPARFVDAPDAEGLAVFEAALADARQAATFVLIDTPGGDTALSRAAHAAADLVVTPMNDSFVDFDLLGHVDPVTLELLKPSIYSETVWNARKARAMRDRGSIDWVVLTNRLATVEARNRKRVDERIAALSRRVGFRVGPGLRDRVIYRELFPFGLTVADLSPEVRPVPISLAHVAARQELRALLWTLGLGEAPQETEAA
ncbi:MAG TPA: division plane positioning ATPase MipZ [Caulobacteraceae bacterium]